MGSALPESERHPTAQQLRRKRLTYGNIQRANTDGNVQTENVLLPHSHVQTSWYSSYDYQKRVPTYALSSYQIQSSSKSNLRYTAQYAYRTACVPLLRYVHQYLFAYPKHKPAGQDRQNHAFSDATYKMQYR